MTEVLYLSYDGMTDPLGQSQVIPYLAGLSKEGFHFHLVSFEKKVPFHNERAYITKLLQSHNITWHPLSYTKKPPVISTMRDMGRMTRRSLEIIEKHQVRIVHCRSYISGIAGMALKKKTGVKLVFDMRGFYADERVDGGLWDLGNPIYKAVYKYFKKKEKSLISGADAVISLTGNARNIINSWNIRHTGLYPIQVIPCCADLEHFHPDAVDTSARQKLAAKLDLESSTPVISYLGAIGTWYMLDEMLTFFKIFLERYPDAVFLFITQESKTHILEKATQQGIDPVNIRVFPSHRNEVPVALSLSDASLFFIKPTFSKQASSPTKQGEIMGMGIPVICNRGVGDTDEVIEKYSAGLLVDVHDLHSFRDAVSKFEEIRSIPTAQIIAGANEFYSLNEGIKKYHEIYQVMLNLK